MTADHTHLVSNGKTELTLEEMARRQPLAAYSHPSTVKQPELRVASRPAYATDVAAYLDEDHDVYGTELLHRRTPAAPPDDLDLTAGTGGAE